MILLRPAGPAPRLVLPGSFNPLHAGHLGLAAAASRRFGEAVHFELSAANVDKPDLPAVEWGRRVEQFAGVAAVWVTQAATFVEKAWLFPGAVFVIGYDTAARVVDPRYYASAAERDAFLASGVRFLVGGRVDAGGVFREWAGGPFEVIPEAEFRVDISSTSLRGRG